MTRRDFIKKAAIFGGASIAACGTAVYFHSKSERHDLPSESEIKIRSFSSEKRNIIAESPDAGNIKSDVPDIVIADAKNLEINLKNAFDELGGLNSFIAKGDRILLKPNMLKPAEPELAVSTNPQLMGVLTALCLEAGAKEVIVTDNCTGNLKKAFEISGIGEEVTNAGGKILTELREFRDVSVGGTVLKKWQFFREFFLFDRVINVPIIKNHSLCRATACMKNWMGVIGGERGLLHQNIHGAIADLASICRPTLNVVDGIRVLMRNGPSGGSTDYVKNAGKILIGMDQVALDTMACSFLEIDPSEVSYLELAEKRGAGTRNLQKLKIKEI
jgi:uncharacterized protein (DUF362 family)